MGLKFYFNKIAWHKIAKQFRLASWSIGAGVSAGGFHLNDARVLVASALLWLLLQVGAVVLESVTSTEDKEK